MGPFQRFIGELGTALATLTEGDTATAPPPPTPVEVAAPAPALQAAPPVPLPIPRPPFPPGDGIARLDVLQADLPGAGSATAAVDIGSLLMRPGLTDPALAYFSDAPAQVRAAGILDALSALPTVVPPVIPEAPEAAVTAAVPPEILPTDIAPAFSTTLDLPLPPIPLSRPAGVQVAALPPVTGPGLALPIPEDRVCLASLSSLGVEWDPLPTIESGACGIASPIAVASIDSSFAEVSFSPEPTIACGVADALSEWLSADVQPAAEHLLGQAVTGIRVASSYSCRGVNNSSSGPLSEHAFGRAIDISAFRLADGTWVEVHPYPANSDDPQEQFLAEIRADACGPFRTVLGPGVALHDDHFHLDLAQRRNDSVYCR